MLPRHLSIVALLLIAQIGCSSMNSTMLTRDESNQFWTRKGALKGVPITLKVPTHVQLTVFERHFLVYDEFGRVSRLTLPYVVRDFSQEFIYSDKIFTVDFKRPAAGTYNLDLDLTEDQYIQKFQYDVTDQTIEKVTSLVQQLVPGGFEAVSALDTYYKEIQSVVAVGMFEIDAPDFEEQMSAFVNCHLNQAHDAWVVPQGVTSVHRAHLTGGQAESNICEGLVVPDNAPIALPPYEAVTTPLPSSPAQ